MGRAPCCDKNNVKKGPWSPEEDSQLKQYIEKYGTGGNWIALPQKVGLKRCGKSCRLRWLNYLRPNIKHGGFSEEEDRIICSLYVAIGSRWSIIAAQLPGRTDNDIKNYWNTKLKKKLLGRRSGKEQTSTSRRIVAVTKQREESYHSQKSNATTVPSIPMYEEALGRMNLPINSSSGAAYSTIIPPTTLLEQASSSTTITCSTDHSSSTSDPSNFPVIADPQEILQAFDAPPQILDHCPIINNSSSLQSSISNPEPTFHNPNTFVYPEVSASASQLPLLVQYDNSLLFSATSAEPNPSIDLQDFGFSSMGSNGDFLSYEAPEMNRNQTGTGYPSFISSAATHLNPESASMWPAADFQSADPPSSSNSSCPQPAYASYSVPQEIFQDVSIFGL